MKLTHSPGPIQFTDNAMNYSFLPTGDIYCFTHGHTMINGYIGNKKDGSANNIWLRIYKGNKPASYPLLGISSGSSLSRNANSLKYSGTAKGISYEVIFHPCGNMWFWDITLEGSGENIDLIYGQDLGMADQAAVLENELYAAQYLGHTVLENEQGFHIGSRQNLPQQNAFPYLQQGMLSGTSVGYSTDGLQFFGLSYKENGTPAALGGNLENRNLQSENSYIALQSEKIELAARKNIIFYCYFVENHAEKAASLESMEQIRSAYADFMRPEEYSPLPQVTVLPQFGKPFSSPRWTKASIDARYPERKLEEYEGGRLLSSFLPDDSHVVLSEKELLTERPHGNIIATQADFEKINYNLITSTNYIYGIFNSQTVIGNTNKHKLFSTARGQLNLFKNSGQRIWVAIDGYFRLLALPSAFETGFHYSRWLYQIHEDILQITAYAVSDAPKIITEVRSLQGKPYDFIVTNQLVMGTHEFHSPVILQEEGDVLHIYPDAAPAFYPGWHYDIQIPDAAYTWSDDRIFFEDAMPQNGTMLCLSLKGESQFHIVVQGFLEEDACSSPASFDFLQEKQSNRSYYDKALCGFYLEKEGEMAKEISKLNTLVKWYAHNALIHYSVPHGLEQAGGAAWGTRDICQGPFEFFLSTQKYALARQILLHIFAHQSALTGEWPQWFMFDKYSDCQEECHGDVIFWPLKCAGDYIRHTQDHSIWEETVPFANNPGSDPLPFIQHVKLAVSSIERRFLPGTFLISYSGGDWDDTLQPADAAMRENLSSSWTQALAFQVFRLLQEAVSGCDSDYALHIKTLCEKIKTAFEQFFIIDGTIAGFVLRSPDGGFSPMLHPADDKTGIHLRLLPLTRSILANLVDAGQAGHNMETIERSLHFPDGVRLMDRPAGYDGGVCHFFRRAEQAANVGREISLQYVHAHIRYIEALCRMGRRQEAWKALFEINPIGIRDYVPHAAYRQSNLYFSSSDGAFYNRQEYSREFQRLRDGSIPVKGGWRIYSSGPGIYISRLIGDILGIRFAGDTLIVDPVLPDCLDGLKFHYQCFGQGYTFIYHISPNPSQGSVRLVQDGQELPSIPLGNPYRPAGAGVRKEDLNPLYREIHVYA